MNRITAQIGTDKINIEKVLNFLPYPILVSEQREGIRFNIFVNKNFEEEIGFTCEEIPRIEDWFEKAYDDPGYRSEIIAEWSLRELSAHSLGAEAIVMQAKINTKRFGKRWYEVKASIHDAIQFVAFIDINDEIEREGELERLNDYKNLSLSILSHDLRSPINSLSAILRLAIDGALSEQEKNEALKKLLINVSELQGFVDTALQWTYSNFSEIKPRYSNVDLSMLVSNLLNIYRGTYVDKKITITVHVTTDTIFSDEGIVNVVLRNLISNAIKFTPEGNDVSIRSVFQENTTLIEVSNTGNVITQQKIAEILTKSYRSEKGTHGEKGLGLGLKLCQQLLQKINGRLEVASSLNETIFKVLLPAIQP